MRKRGQVTIFVIIGIVILIAFALAFLVASGRIDIKLGVENVQLRLSNVFDNIKAEEIDRCVKSETEKAVVDLLENGGDFEVDNFLRYKGNNFRVLCSAISGKDICLSNPLFLNVIEEKMNSRLSKAVFSCVDLSAYRGKDYNVETGELIVNVSVHPENLVVNVNYPIKISKETVEFEKENFVYNFNVPLGEIVKATNDVLNSESSLGVFEPLSYGVLSLNKYNIVVKKPYPDKIYFVSLTKYPEYVLGFAVTGNSRFE